MVTIDSSILMLYHVSLSVENSISSSGRRSNGDDFMLNYVDAPVVSLASLWSSCLIGTRQWTLFHCKF